MSGYNQMLVDVGVSQEEMQAMVDVDNVVEFDSDMYHKSDSNIHGVGVFASKCIEPGCVIGLGSIDQKYRTVLGRWTNHSNNNNARFYYTKHGDLLMVSVKPINRNDEILINYRQHSLEKAYYV